jgi:hypothetical protein
MVMLKEKFKTKVHIGFHDLGIEELMEIMVMIYLLL